VRSSFALVLTCLVHVLASTAWAPCARADDEDAPEYRETIQQGVAEFREHNYPEARALFLDAHAQRPTARTARALGATAFELRAYVESIRYLEQALASTVRPLDPTLREQTEALLARAYRLVARVGLTLVPADARVVVDGREVQPTDGTSLILDPGEHELAFRAEGYVPETRTLQVRGGEEESLRIVLDSQADGAAPTPRQVAEQATRNDLAAVEQPRTSRRARPVYKSPWLWTGVGAVVVSAVAVAVGMTAARGPKVRTGPVMSTEYTPEGRPVEVE